MSEQTKRFWQGGARAVTGIAVIGVSVAAAFGLGTALPASVGVHRGVVALEVDTQQNSRLSLICPGAFGELGADPTRPTSAIPGGETRLVIAGETPEQDALRRDVDAGTAPRVLTAGALAPLAAAETQQVSTPTLQGLVASSCVEPMHEQWLVGGATGLGVSSTLILGNPFDVPATVHLTVFDEKGEVESANTAGVLVQPKSQQTVSINGYAPARERLVVRVESTGAAVSAALGISQVVDIRSYAVDTVTRQASPATTLAFAGVANVADNEHSGPAGSQPDDFPVTVRLFAPGAEAGAAEITALFADGRSESLGTVEFEPLTVAEFSVPRWPAKAQGILVEASAPVVGGAFGSADVAPGHDYAWFAPSPLLAAESDVSVAIIDGAALTLVNPGDTEATVTLTSDAEGAAPLQVSVPARAAVATAAKGAVTLRSDQPIAAGVRLLKGSNIAAYPVIPPSDKTAALTVYPR